jgi:hypothetical protein
MVIILFRYSLLQNFALYLNQKSFLEGLKSEYLTEITDQKTQTNINCEGVALQCFHNLYLFGFKRKAL